MIDKEKGTLKVHNDEGIEKDYSILFTFDFNGKNKSCVGYTDYSVNENGNTNVYASIYREVDGKQLLEKIIDKEELNIVNNFIKNLDDDLKSGIKFI